jgi:hypothetical protein
VLALGRCPCPVSRGGEQKESPLPQVVVGLSIDKFTPGARLS